MKRIKILPLLLLIFILNVASTCSNDDDVSSSNQDPTPVINAASQGTWRITLYEDSGNNETANFAGYNFTFAASNVLTASNGVNTYTGTWSVTNTDVNDDSSSNDLDFNIAFLSPEMFSNELTDDWDIQSYSSTKIELVDVSGGNGGTDFLTFEKN
ncbi:conserved exported hypothetical protein [Flavobacterium sp. 9AF]|uniref:hypothetical protein n=1 Tax=Flavobacterium sp. 9AF TaxID=2653142 RepID=UPI0012F0EB23|nr:hypothetical protein [Flavobacterium sp. 9AF]VXB53996.1 conserved exported hypothetical protein [Flavobacterium sp. 9AF]